jgi:hypothetical protein
VPDSSGSNAERDARGERFRSDNPIRRSYEDSLGRADVAASFARHILSLDAAEGLVVGVLGPWGSGKTSFINLARSELEEAGATILDFNPWMFSGAEQLVDSFFVELAAQLKMRPGLAEIGESIGEYGESFSGLSWLPLVGPWIDRGRGAAKIVSAVLQRRKEGVGSRRAKLERALTPLRNAIVVVLDDIDRLSSQEVRDVFKLVRLTASFPNVIYVLAFDRVRVEMALGTEGITGRDYLEKILQVAVDLPAVSGPFLQRELLAGIDDGIAGIDNPGPFDEQAWPDVFVEIVRPLVRNMRDVRRYSTSIRGTVTALKGQIALVDVLALEAVRVFLPDVFARLHGAVEALTTTSGALYGEDRQQPHLKAAVQALVELGGTRTEVVRALIQRLFPAAERHLGGSHFGSDFERRWLRERRIAHGDFLRLYLERIVGDSLQAQDHAARAWSVMADRQAFDRYLRSLQAEQLEDVISALETFEDQFAPEHVVSGSVVLLNLLASIPERRRGMFEFETRMVVGRVTYRLLRSLREPSAIESAAREILPQLKSLSAKLEVLSDIGYRENVGHKLVSEQAAADLEREWREEVRATSGPELARETDLLRVLLRTKKDARTDEPTLQIPDTPEVTLAILRSAKTETRSQSVDSRAVRREPELAWKSLIELFGDEATIEQRVGLLKQSNPEAAGDLLELADRYLGGWKPDDD